MIDWIEKINRKKFVFLATKLLILFGITDVIRQTSKIYFSLEKFFALRYSKIWKIIIEIESFCILNLIDFSKNIFCFFVTKNFHTGSVGAIDGIDREGGEAEEMASVVIVRFYFKLSEKDGCFWVWDQKDGFDFNIFFKFFMSRERKFLSELEF